MAVDHIRYDLRAQNALRGLVRDVLAETAKKGLPGEHHFYISFDTRADGVRLSPRLREQYPEEMTIVLQHQFWDLKVSDDGFEVGLSFGGVPERLAVPLTAIKSFVDPSVQFALQFEQIEPDAGVPPAKPKNAGKADRPSVPSVPLGEKSNARPRRAPPPARVGAAAPPAPLAPAKPPTLKPLAEKSDRPEKPDKPEKLDKPEKPDKPDKPRGGAEVVPLDRFRKK